LKELFTINEKKCFYTLKLFVKKIESKLNGILHFSFKDYDNKETAIKKLYELLDKNLYTINPK
jgi:hypothetical protein